MRLVEQNACRPPRALFVPPVAELGGDDRINVGTDLRIPHHRRCIACGLQGVLQGPLNHDSYPSPTLWVVIKRHSAAPDATTHREVVRTRALRIIGGGSAGIGTFVK